MVGIDRVDVGKQCVCSVVQQCVEKLESRVCTTTMYYYVLLLCSVVQQWVKAEGSVSPGARSARRL